MQVIDAQCHWHSRTYFEAYLSRTDYPRAEKTSEGYVFYVSEESLLPIPPHYLELELQLEQLEACGVDVLISSMGTLGVEELPVEEAVELAMALNAERGEAQTTHAGRFYGLAVLPMQDTDAALMTLDHAIDDCGLVGVCIGSNIGGQPISSDHCRPVYARMAELGAPLFIHPARTIMEDRLRRNGYEYSIGFMVDTSLAALDLVFAGILDEVPDLEVVHPHLGGVLPYLAQRIDHEYAQPWALGKELERPPSAYLPRFYTDTISRNPGALKLARAVYGIERLLFGSDYPYWPPREAVEFLKEQLDQADLAAVFEGNARRLLGLESR